MKTIRITEFNVEQLQGGPVLVTGGTGFTGSHLLRRLTAAGLDVRAVARPTSDRTALEALPVHWFLGDVFDTALIERAMQGVRYVFHLATLYRSGDATEEEHRDVHLKSTRLLAEAAVRQPSFMRFVQVSTVGVHGHIEHPPADETAPFRPGDEYQRTKAEAEEWLARFAAEHDLPYTIVRPCGIYGPGDLRLLKLFRMARHRIAPILGRKPCLYHLIHVEDLVSIMLRCATHPAALGEPFIAGNPEPVPLDHLLAMMARAQGRTTRVVRVPVAPFWLLAILCEKVCPPLGLKPPLYRRRIKFFLNDRSFDTRKLRNRLGFTCSYTEEAGIRKTAQWYQKHGML
jgi:dihydroflavonol-4-reductase